MNQHEKAKILLQNIQSAMTEAGYWSEVEISAQALLSQQPFCCDTMSFAQWQQFVFIPRMQALIRAGQELPILTQGQGIEPMASEFYKETVVNQALMALIRQFDILLQQD
jgi:uncharacterized protein YqcC (DUF446 family)